MNNLRNSKIKSFFALTLGGMACLACLSGCNPTTASSQSSIPYVDYDSSTYGDPTALKADVSFWVTSGKQNLDAINSLITAFNKIYPNITITPSQQGGYSDIEQKISQAIPAGTTPTMSYCYSDHVATYLAANAVMDMSSLVTDPTIGFLASNEDSEGHHSESGVDKYGVDDYVSGYWDEGTAYQTSGLYSVPFTKSMEALYYNKTVFDNEGWTVPTTWEDMWSLCDTIKAAHSNYIPLGYDSDSNLFITALASNDVPYTSATGAHYLFNNDAAKAFVKTWVDYYNKGEFVTKGVLPNNQYTSTKFTSQEILMIVSSTGGTSYADTSNFDVGVAPMPSYSGHDLKVISQGPSICIFNRASWAQKYAAWLFYKFCTNSTNSAYLATQSTGYDPVRISSYNTDYYTSWLSDNASTLYGKAAQVTEGMRDSAFYSPSFVGSSTARDEVGSIFGNVVQNGKTIDEAFKAAYDACITG